MTHRRVLRPPVRLPVDAVLLVHARYEGRADASGGLLVVLTHAAEEVARPSPPCLVVSAVHVSGDVVFGVELGRREKRNEATRGVGAALRIQCHSMPRTTLARTVGRHNFGTEGRFEKSCFELIVGLRCVAALLSAEQFMSTDTRANRLRIQSGSSKYHLALLWQHVNGGTSSSSLAEGSTTPEGRQTTTAMSLQQPPQRKERAPHLKQLLVGFPHGDVGDGDLLDDLREGFFLAEEVLVYLLAHHERQELDARRRQDVVMLPGRHLKYCRKGTQLGSEADVKSELWLW